MSVRVDNEIGRLERVLVHQPGAAIERMTQHELGELLFDDILSPDEAAREHALLRGVLQGAGAEVLELQDELARALERAPQDARSELIDGVCALAGAGHVAPRLMDWASERLARGLIEGIHWSELGDVTASLARLRARLLDPRDMVLRPQPNLMFMRDPCIAVQDRVVVGRMAQPARAREPLLVSFALRWSGSAPAPSFLHADDLSAHHEHRTLEGGDVLVLSPEVVLIGSSERTTAQAIERLLHEALFPVLPRLQRGYAVLMPHSRSVMHLDTIVTQIDDGLFLGHRPSVAGQEGAEPLPVVRLERGRPPELVAGACLLDVLREELGEDTELVSCGGDDPVHQEREQWTDGANAVCLAPGHVLLYSRNVRTIEELSARGFEEIRLHVAQPADLRRRLMEKGFATARAVFSFSGSELSRARGGGRCLTMPLRRKSL